MQKTALVTGGSRGIGAATAKTLTSRGWRVAFVYKSGSGTAHELQQECGALPLQGDVSNEADVQRIFSEASSHLGTPITHLVNNAGTFGPGKELEHSEVDDMTDVLNTNVLGPMLCSRELIRRQSIKNGGQGGAIVNISSGAAYQCSPTTPLYSVSKGAVNSLNHALAGGLNFEDHGIRANAVSPGLTNTDMVANVDFSRITSTLPARRVGDPQEIANTVVFLLDDELSSYTHGANIRVAGGRL